MTQKIFELVEQFIAGDLPKSQWTHEAHLRVGLWHVLNYGSQTATILLRERIRTYNESVGTPNTPASGYHETITRFYVLVITKFLESQDRNLSVDDLAQQLLAIHGDRELPLKYYSRELLFSSKARLEWVPPDISSI